MSKEFTFLCMIFCHIVDDYYLQGVLASMKQKSWWESKNLTGMYAKDYIWALLMHAFSWSFMIMLPIAIYLEFQLSPLFIAMLITNWLCHALVDDFKANRGLINLCQDQIIHIVQILCTAFALLVAS